VPYYVCHKCGLTRRREPPGNRANLGSCRCIGQTEFESERTPRTRDEAIVIGVRRFLEYIALYISEGREPWRFGELTKHYEKVLAYKAVYKVEIRR